MKQAFAGLLTIAFMAATGCALKEAVTPPPPAYSNLSSEAQALLARPIKGCAAPAAKTKTSVLDRQAKALVAEHEQVQVLVDKEIQRWERRRAYLEDELEFYEKEVRRTGGNWSLSKTSAQPVPLKLTTDGNFTEQVRKQREREYNEDQYRRFHKALKRGQAKHERLLGLYQTRQDQLTQAMQGCKDLKVALLKAQEEAELNKNTRAVPNFRPALQVEVVEVEPLPVAEQALPVPSEPEVPVQQTAEKPGVTDSLAEPTEQADIESFTEQHADTMEELLQMDAPVQVAQP